MPQGSGAMARLIVIRGVDEGATLELNGESMILGREGSSPLRLHDTEVSRRHALFEKHGTTWRVKDLGSANGTHVNDRAIADVQLRPGDQIRIGQSILVFSCPGEATAAQDLAERIRLVSQQGKAGEMGTIVGRLGEKEAPIGAAPWDQQSGTHPDWLKTAISHLGVLFETSRALSQFSNLDQLLDRILTLVYQTLGADRACILLLEEGGQLQSGQAPDPTRLVPRAVRHFQTEPDSLVKGAPPIPKTDPFLVSRTLLDHVLVHREGLLVNDTTLDSRFQQARSIVQNRVREILCVPMQGRHEIVGVLYADRLGPESGHETPGKTSVFNMDHLRVAGAIAYQAALAVEESRHYDAMIQAERLAAVGQTIAGVSHHIKNILQGLKSGGEILGMGVNAKDWELVNQGWRIVERNQGKIYDLVLDMLGYSKEREPAWEPCDLNKIAQEVIDLEMPLAKERGVALNLSPCLALSTVEADPEGLHRSLLNLVGNAIDAVDETPNPRVEVEVGIEPGGFASIYVRDNGPGIPPEELEAIFRPFFSTKGSQGTGLGLPVSRKILREHGGDLLVKSVASTQTEFQMRIPIKRVMNPENTLMSFSLDPG